MRVLAIDGGGIRGIIPALVLTEIERRSGKRIFELFDLIAGTSTGGILACALCAPDPLPAEQLVAIYEEEGPAIFDRSVWQRIRSAEGLLDEKYDAGALDLRQDQRRDDPADAAAVDSQHSHLPRTLQLPGWESPGHSWRSAVRELSSGRWSRLPAARPSTRRST